MHPAVLAANTSWLSHLFHDPDHLESAVPESRLHAGQGWLVLVFRQVVERGFWVGIFNKFGEFVFQGLDILGYLFARRQFHEPLGPIADLLGNFM